VEVNFFRNALQKVEARRQQTDISGEKASTTKFEMPLQGGLSIERMCQLAQMVNHKRVARIMRTDNLLTIQNRGYGKSRIATTNWRFILTSLVA